MSISLTQSGPRALPLGIGWPTASLTSVSKNNGEAFHISKKSEVNLRSITVIYSYPTTFEQIFKTFFKFMISLNP